MRRVTIKDIAKIAGVSYATVSRALSGSPEISEPTRQRIIEICSQEGYLINSLARSLICNKTNVLGLIVPEITNPFYSEISFYIEMCAQQLGYNVMLCNSRYDETLVNEVFELLVGHRVDGIILASSRQEIGNCAAKYAKKVPTVLLGETAENGLAESEELNVVCANNRAGGRIGAQYLSRLGHKSILYFGFRPSGSTTHQLRLQGFRAAAEALGQTVRVLENPWDCSNIAHGYALGKRLFTAPRDYSAIFAATDSMALGLLQAADEFGVRVPDDVSLLGFDNISYAALPKIALTTVDQRKQHLSETAVNLLMRVIESPDDEDYTKHMVTPALVERATCRSLIETP